MKCIHGFDIINCPICRINSSMVPSNILEPKRNQLLRKDNPLLRENLDINQALLKELLPLQKESPLKSFQQISKPKLINTIPNIKDSLFKKRLNELDIAKSDKFGINKRVKVKSPEFEFDKIE